MARLIQYCTRASLYDGAFGGEAGWAAAGMGYILQADSGELIVIDGGHAEDAESILSLLKELSPTARPEVALWIITHPHSDHYGALLQIAETPSLYSRLTLRTLAYSFPAGFRTAGGADLSQENAHIHSIQKATGAQELCPQIGQKLHIGGLLLHFLFAPEDPSALNNPNQLSLIFTVQSKTKKALFTGDAYANTMQLVLERYPAALPCDILQLPHHGLCDTGHTVFYQQVNAGTVLVPISIAGDRCMRSDLYGDAPAANRFAQENAQNICKAFAGTATLEF